MALCLLEFEAPPAALEWALDDLTSKVQISQAVVTLHKQFASRFIGSEREHIAGF